MVPTDDRHPTAEQLEAFARGEMDEANSSTIEDHLAACDACSGRIDRCSSEDHLIRLVREVGWKKALPTAPMRSVPLPTGYELIEPLGRGGMGVVFKARQRSLGRLVALKRIKAGIDANPTELARFRAEARGAASLSHPNIVKVYEVGEQDGLPFLAMELIEGGSLADRLADGPLRAIDAARLVETLALAIGHAHDHGIVHRDLKPANILMAADGTPRIADFGLAKLQEATGPTLPGAILGTPRYMAPEQADGREIGPGVDIHALGAILHECLTGRPAFLAAEPLRLLEQIRSVEPIPPGRLQPGLPRDLETISMKCLEKDPQRRYATARDLADDLGRFLRSEPIRARPIGPVERLSKWVRRRPHQAALVAVSSIAVIGLLAGLLIHQSRLQAEFDKVEEAASMARAQKDLADANYREARATIQEILDCHQDPSFVALPRRSELLLAQAEKALLFYDRLLNRPDSSEPVVALDLARAASEAATTQYTVGRRELAVGSLVRALRLIETASAGRGEDAEVLLIRALTRARLGIILMQASGASERSLEVLRLAVADAERLAEMHPDNAEYRAALSLGSHNLGTVLMGAGRVEPALAAFRRAIEINRGIYRERPDDKRRRYMLAENLNNIGLLTDRSDPVASDRAYGESEGLLEGLPKDQRDDHWADIMGSIQNNRGVLDGRQGRLELALARFATGLEIVEERLGRQPLDAILRRCALNLHGSRANRLAAMGRFDGAIADWDRVIELNDNPADDRRLRLLRMLSLVRSADYDRGTDEADSMFRGMMEAGRAPPDVADVYNLACVLSLGSAAAWSDVRITPEQRRDRAGKLAESAIECLRFASKLGFFREPSNRENARRDSDLNPLRDHPGFSEILGTEPPVP